MILCQVASALYRHLYSVCAQYSPTDGDAATCAGWAAQEARNSMERAQVIGEIRAHNKTCRICEKPAQNAISLVPMGD